MSKRQARRQNRKERRQERRENRQERRQEKKGGKVSSENNVALNEEELIEEEQSANIPDSVGEVAMMQNISEDYVEEEKFLGMPKTIGIGVTAVGGILILGALGYLILKK